MRNYTEPVAEFKNTLALGSAKKSWKPPADPEHMPVGYWVDCEGFRELRIEAVGDADFTVVVYSFPEDVPVPPAPDPALLDHITLKALPMNPPVLKSVTQTIDINGAKGIGVELLGGGMNGDAAISLRAFLLY